MIIKHRNKTLDYIKHKDTKRNDEMIMVIIKRNEKKHVLNKMKKGEGVKNREKVTWGNASPKSVPPCYFQNRKVKNVIVDIIC